MPRARWEGAVAQRNCNESLSKSSIWLARLPGGLPVDFDYRVIKSAADAKTLILELPSGDRGRAAVELHRHRDLIGAVVAYRRGGSVRSRALSLPKARSGSLTPTSRS